MTKDVEKESRVQLDLGGLEVDRPQPIDMEHARKIANQSGFSGISERGAANEDPGSIRRRGRRLTTGRVHQFNTRLKAKTLEAIYAYADQHEITLAETIERAMGSLVGGIGPQSRA